MLGNNGVLRIAFIDEAKGIPWTHLSLRFARLPTLNTLSAATLCNLGTDCNRMLTMNAYTRRLD